MNTTRHFFTYYERTPLALLILEKVITIGFTDVTEKQS